MQVDDDVTDIYLIAGQTEQLTVGTSTYVIACGVDATADGTTVLAPGGSFALIADDGRRVTVHCIGAPSAGRDDPALADVAEEALAEQELADD